MDHFNPRSSCEERLVIRALFDFRIRISIHAPHARSDEREKERRFLDLVISIHAPHARSDKEWAKFTGDIKKFQSTLLMRGATSRCRCRRLLQDISIHAPHARSDPMVTPRGVERHISIHAPHARSDRASCRSAHKGRHFNPRSSCEERQVHADALEHFLAISIHAPHARSDVDLHPPRLLLRTFQSTLLMRGATSN